MATKKQVKPTLSRRVIHDIEITSVCEAGQPVQVFMGGGTKHPRKIQFRLATGASPCRIIFPAGYFRGYENRLLDIMVDSQEAHPSPPLELVKEVQPALPAIRYIYDLDGNCCKKDKKVPPPEIVIEAP